MAMAAIAKMRASPSIDSILYSGKPCCPNCATSGAQAQHQIDELNAQIKLLNEKATAAVDKWADYEDELTRLREQLKASPRNSAGSVETGVLPSAPSTTKEPTAAPAAATGAYGYLPRFLSARTGRTAATPTDQPKSPGKPPSNSNLQVPSSTAMTRSSSAPTPDIERQSTDDLLAALNREQQLRLTAEGKLNDTSREVEELSATLFEQANEMVASERRERAKLEERVEMLEKRDVEKRRRLERLEGALQRIERVRALLGPTGVGVGLGKGLEVGVR